MIFEPYELGENVVIRDAYIFAAPILCDVESASGKWLVSYGYSSERLFVVVSFHKPYESSSRTSSYNVAYHKCKTLRDD